MSIEAPDALDAALADLDASGPLLPESYARIANVMRREHDRIKREATIAETAHVHDVPHLSVTTTEPLAHLMEACTKGADVLVLQPRHVATLFGQLTIGEGKAQETVKVLSVLPLWDGDPVHDVLLASLVKIEGKTAHAHQAGTAVSSQGHDPESVDASGVICHDCKQYLLSDAGSERILVCPRVHGHRPAGMVPKHADGAVECGQP